MDDADALAAPAAAQISQADIIERQAETIARLQRQVKRGSEYKQLTKSKLKEAAARLKEYRVRVETLLREEKALQKQLTDASKAHEKTKQQHKIAALKAKKHSRSAATQTAAETKVTRSSQTQLSGQVERVNKKKTTADSGVQTVDTIASTRKRGRASAQTEADQLVPKLSRHPPLGGHNETSEDATPTQETVRQTWTPLQPLGSTTFAHETSAALDAELAFSDSDEESGDTLEVVESGETGAEAGAGAGSGFDAAVLSEIDKELAFSSDEEEEAPRPAAESETGGGTATQDTNGKDRAADVALLRAVDAVVQSEIDKELETSSDEDDEGPTAERRRTIGAEPVGNIVVDTPRTRTEAATADSAGRLHDRGLDAAVSNDIDKELETSSDEEDVEDSLNAKKAGQAGLVTGAGGDVTDSSRPLVSIDDELDDEFAALDTDSEPEHHEEQKTANGSKDGDDSSSSSSSSDSNSSDSSETDSDEDEDDPMTGTADKALTGIAAILSLGPAAEKEAQVDRGGERGASPPSTDTNPVVLTIPVKKKAVTASEDVYSPVVAGQLPSQTPEPLQLDTSATVAVIRSKDEEEPNVAVASQRCLAQKKIPTPPSPTKTAAGNVIAGAVLTGTSAPSNQTSSPRSPASKQPAVLTSSSKEDQPTASEATSDSSQPSFPVPLDSAEPGELVRSPIAQAKRSSPDAQASEIRSPTEDTSLGRVRKADEANLDDSRAGSLQKKVKRDEISGRTESGRKGKEPPVGAATGDSKAKKKPAVNGESKEERRMKKSLAVFKQAIVLGKGEEADNDYARRTIAVLVNQSSRFIDTHLVHVTTLCQVLADAFRELEVSSITVVRGALGVFRTPRSRRLLQESKLGLSWLCNQMLLRLMCRGDEIRKQDAAVASDSLTLSLVHDCLQHLRSFLVEERASIGDFLPASKLQVPVATQQINVSHDKVFLAHIIALHTHLCQSTGQLSRSRVLLFDIVRDNPNIRGLYLAMVMLEVYPAILEREFDQQLVERHVMLKETLQQALVVISGAAALREELLLHQSSITMLHRIADAIQMPELEEVDGTNPDLPRTCVEKLFSKLSPEDASPAVYFELAKCLEVCTAVYGLDLVTETFSIERCQDLFNKADVEAKSGILSIVGHIAMAITPKTSDTQNPRTRGEQYVESVVDWLHQLLAAKTTDDKTSAEDRFKLCVRCSTVCVELILDYSAPAALDVRRRVLCEIVNWFDATPPDQLLGLPATFLRRLRLAVVAARPQVVPAAV